MADAIAVSGLQKSFKTLKVLDGISFTVPAGSIFALLGANGAGKTTMVRILATLLKPDSGTATVNGFDVVGSAARVRDSISLTGQFTAVDDVLTGKENLELVGRLRHLSDHKTRAAQMLTAFDLTDAANRAAGSYSGGMRRRLDLAMSLIAQPAVLFLDEPTTGLDPQARIAVWQLIRELRNSGTTVFLTTQYLDEADQLADEIAILNHGNIVAQGTPAQLKSRLPHGSVTFSFEDSAALNTAAALVGGVPNHESLSVSVTTDGSVGQLTKLLNRLEDSGVSVTAFSQQQPTLDDVFFSIVESGIRESA
jgi:ABC-2 type transport system ATP-binding protein